MTKEDNLVIKDFKNYVNMITKKLENWLCNDESPKDDFAETIKEITGSK